MPGSRLSTQLVVACVFTAGYAATIDDWSSASPELRFDDINRARYMLTAFPLFGVVTGDLLWTLRRNGWQRERRVIIALGLLCAVALARVTLHVPVSGHLALASYALLWTRSLPEGRLRLGSRVAFFVAAAWFAWLHDPLTDLTAVLVGAGLGAFAFLRPSS